jgi:steroid delta-isomerase-like uncharacterized protein
MAAEEQRALAGRLLNEVWNRGNVALIDELVAPTFVRSSPPELAEEVRGRAAFKQLVRRYRTAFPDLQVTTNATIAERDMIVTGWTAQGTHQGPFLGLAPTGRPVRVVGIAILHFAGGHISEARVSFDVGSLREQLGALSLPIATPPPTEVAGQA